MEIDRAGRARLFLVSTPIGNLKDITYRAVEILKDCHYIAAEDTRTSKRLLDHYAIADKKLISYFGPRETERARLLLDLLLKGNDIALVTDAGTPGISDPAAKIVRLAIAHGIQVIPIPGASALLAGISASGLNTDSFVFEGFLPVKSGRRAAKLAMVARAEQTVILFESTHRIAKLLGELEMLMPARHIVVAREITKLFEEFLRGTPTEIRSQMQGKRLKGEMVVLIPSASAYPLELPPAGTDAGSQ